MAFESIRTTNKSKDNKCVLCNKNPSVGTILVQIKDKENSAVASRTGKVCEACGTAAFPKAVEAIGI